MKPNNETGKHHQPLYSVLVGERPDISLAARTMAAMRVKKLSPARRKEIAQNAAKARWGATATAAFQGGPR